MDEIRTRSNDAEAVEREEAAPSERSPGSDDARSPDDAAAIAPGSPAIEPILERIAQIETMVAQLAGGIDQLARQVQIIPQQVRALGAKVDGIAESISEPRIRDLLGHFLLLYDLVEQMGRSAAGTPDFQNYQILRDQIAQTLHVNGISPIVATGRFDPEIHKAVEMVACAQPGDDGVIAGVYRTGFRTAGAVLRYAEVLVNRYQPPQQAMEVFT